MLGVLRSLYHLRRALRWPAGRIQARRLPLLLSVVSDAQRRVPLYRDKLTAFEAVSLRGLSEFQDLPILTKREVKANFPDRILREGMDRSRLHPVATSGTTDRVMLFQDEAKRNWDRAADLLLALYADRFRLGQRRLTIPPDACYERCGADSGGHPATIRSQLRELWSANGKRRSVVRKLRSQIVREYFWRDRVMRSLGVDGTAVQSASLDKYLVELGEWRPQLLACLPVYAHVLARHQLRSSSKCNVAVVRPSGGKMTEEMRRTVESAFSAVVRENYGTAELGTIAFDCEYSRYQHLLTELFYVEIVRGSRPTREEELGELLITDLRNSAAPLIRYAVGDVGRWHSGPCKCGFEGLLFSVSGTVVETIVTPAGRAFGPDEVVDFFLAQPGIDYVKIIQRGTAQFVLEYVPAPDAPAPADEELGGTFSAFLGYPVQLTMREVRRIAPERSGKYRLVVSDSWRRLHDTAPGDATAHPVRPKHANATY